MARRLLIAILARCTLLDTEPWEVIEEAEGNRARSVVRTRDGTYWEITLERKT